MRSLLPGGDGFLFVSSEFYKRLISPGFRIAVLRRDRCMKNLSMLDSAVDLSRMEGKDLRSLESLEAAGYLAYRPVCPHRGRYVFDGGASVFRCGHHGRRKRPAVLSKTPVAGISILEKRAYEQFARKFRGGFWSRLLDPVGIEVSLEPSLRFSTYVLPRPGSRGLGISSWSPGSPRALAGGEAMLPSAGVMASMAVMDLSLKGLAREGSGTRQSSMRLWLAALSISLGWDLKTAGPLDWVGSEVNFLVIPPVGGENGAPAVPYARLEVRDAPLAATFFRRLVGMQDREIWSIREAGLPEGIRLLCVPASGAAGAPLFVLTEERLFMVQTSSRRGLDGAGEPKAGTEEERGEQNALALVQRLVDRERELDVARRAVADGKQDPTIANTFFGVDFRRASFLRDEILVQAEARHRARCRRNLARLEALEGIAKAGALDGRDKRLATLTGGMRALGPVRCPDGGVYRLEGRRASCSLHGTLEDSKSPRGLPESDPLAVALATLHQVKGSLALTRHGVYTDLLIRRNGEPDFQEWNRLQVERYQKMIRETAVKAATRPAAAPRRKPGFGRKRPRELWEQPSKKPVH